MTGNEHICNNKLKKFIFKLKSDHEIVKPFIPSNSKVLDFGCGDGRFFDNLGTVGKKVGCEIDEERVKTAKDKGYEVYNSLEEIDDTFDFVVLNEVVEHLDLEETKDFLRKIKPMLNSKGQVIMSTPNPNEAYTKLDDYEDHKKLYSIKELKQLGKEQGFKTIRAIKHHIRIHPFKILRNLLTGKDIHSGITVFLEKQD